MKDAPLTPGLYAIALAHEISAVAALVYPALVRLEFGAATLFTGLVVPMARVLLGVAALLVARRPSMARVALTRQGPKVDVLPFVAPALAVLLPWMMAPFFVVVTLVEEPYGLGWQLWRSWRRRVPSSYFMFASSGKGVAPADIRRAASIYGAPIMVMFDSGALEEQAASVAAAREVGAQLAVYVEGPGGATGRAWTPDERERIRVAAASVGFTGTPHAIMTGWDGGGWKTYTFRQLAHYRKLGYVAAEIDNLERVLGGKSAALLAFYTEYARGVAAGQLPTLIMKNINESRMQAVVAAVLEGKLPRAMLSEYHIAEEDSGNRARMAELSAKIAVRTLHSDDTYNYAACGEYGLERAFAKHFP